MAGEKDTGWGRRRGMGRKEGWMPRSEGPDAGCIVTAVGVAGGASERRLRERDDEYDSSAVRRVRLGFEELFKDHVVTP